MYTSSGKIIYRTEQKQGWYFVKADDQIGEYYKWLYSRGGFGWSSCMNGVHITFIAGEKDSRLVTASEMKPFLNKTIEFTYSGVIYTNTRAFWIPIQSDELQDIRHSLGLPKHDKLHLTLGNNKHLENQ